MKTTEVHIGFVVDQTTLLWLFCAAFTSSDQAREWADRKAAKTSRAIRKVNPDAPMLVSRVESLPVRPPTRASWLEPLIARMQAATPGANYSRAELLAWVKRWKKRRTPAELWTVFENCSWCSRDRGGVR